jgi:hypothetical protein
MALQKWIATRIKEANGQRRGGWGGGGIEEGGKGE